MKCLVKNVRHTRTLKVHQANANCAPVCGGGNGGKSVSAWQEDIGPCNCGRCRALAALAIKRKAAKNAETAK